MTPEAFQSLCDEVRAEGEAENARLSCLPYPTGCYWSDGSMMVPFWREYWAREAAKAEPAIAVVETPTQTTQKPGEPIPELTLFFEEAA